MFITVFVLVTYGLTRENLDDTKEQYLEKLEANTLKVSAMQETLDVLEKESLYKTEEVNKLEADLNKFSYDKG